MGQRGTLLRDSDGGGSGRFANRPYRMVVRGNEGMGPRIREDNGGGGSDGSRRDVMGGERAVREPPLQDGCQRE